MDLLKISTAGSVDDGKSTLIGRLLYETKSVTKDKLEAIERASKRKGLEHPDLALLTDGLMAEREQGITIDVAHIYFQTPKRKYIIADSPGHFEYTRNMFTGASNAEAAIILVDARKGISPQTYRHFYITQMIGIKHIAIAINKMDLVDYSQDTYNNILADFEKLFEKIGIAKDIDITFIPMSALTGENVVKNSSNLNWFKGQPLLTWLEAIEVGVVEGPARFQVQTVIRTVLKDNPDYRGFAGKINSGLFKKGQTIKVLPNNFETTITKIEKAGVEQESAKRNESVVLHIADEIDLSRGAQFVDATDTPQAVKNIEAEVCWLESNPISAGKTYVIQHGITESLAKVEAVISKKDVEHLTDSDAEGGLFLNEIGKVRLKLNKELFPDDYKVNRFNGSFLLVDRQTNTTAGLGLVSL